MDILVTLSRGAYERIFRAEHLQRLEKLGAVTLCLDEPELQQQDRVDKLWLSANVVVTGWGTRAPSAAAVESLTRLQAVCHAAGTVRGLPRRLVERGVLITSARAAIARTVAEYCLSAAILMLRGGPEGARLGTSDRRLPSATLFGKTVALVGFGHVGREFRALLQPFGCRVLVVDPLLKDREARSYEVTPASLTGALQQARVLSLHVPDLPGTRGLIGAAELAAMQDGAVLINSSRGRVVDTEALTAELCSFRIAAALDVTDPEPLPMDHPLRRLPAVWLTPHVAGPTDDDLPRLADRAVSEVERVARGEPPLAPVSLQDYDRMSF